MKTPAPFGTVKRSLAFAGGLGMMFATAWLPGSPAAFAASAPPAPKLGAVPVPTTAATAEEFAPGRVIELPKFEVVDTRVLPPPEKWRYAEVPGVEILSNVSERETKRFVRDFLLLQTALEVLMPGITQSRTALPTALIMCGRKGFEEFIPARDADATYSRNSMFFDNAERAAIVIDFALQELRYNDGAIEEADTYRAFYTEYFRHLVRRSAGKTPEWFEEGLVQVMSSIDHSKKYIEFGRIGDGFGGIKPGDFNVTLTKGGREQTGLALMPMAKMFAGKPSGQDLRRWRAQCYAFVHLCLYGMNKKYQAGFLKFIQRLDEEPLSEELFKECFQKTYRQMAIELRGYAEFTVHSYVRMTAKKGQELPEPPAVVFTDAPDAVVGRIKGEVLRLANRGTAARNALIAPYLRGERDPRLLAALGLDERLAGQDDRARKFLEAAAAGNVDRARAWLELARLRYAEARGADPASRVPLDDKQREAVLTALRRARQLPPAMPGTYALMTEVWSQSSAVPSREEYMVVVEGVQKFPRDSSLLMQAALLGAKSGFPDDALKLAEHGVKISRNTDDRERFQSLAEILRGKVSTAVVEPVTVR